MDDLQSRLAEFRAAFRDADETSRLILRDWDRPNADASRHGPRLDKALGTIDRAGKILARAAESAGVDSSPIVVALRAAREVRTAGWEVFRTALGWPWDSAALLNAAEDAVERAAMRLPAAPATAARAPMSKDEAERIATRLAKQDREFRENPSQRGWASRIGCSPGTVKKLDTYKTCKKQMGKTALRRRANAVRSGDGPLSPKAVGFTTAMAGTVGRADAYLKRLIEEQAADDGARRVHKRA